MSRNRLIGTAAAILAAAGVALFAGSNLPPNVGPLLSAAGAADASAPLYYQDPDGKPLYSPTPKKTEDGRDYVAVPATADTPDQPATMTAAKNSAKAQSDRKVKYYRNPMGLPDTSPVPKKDSMGMDYIPVYEGDDSDDGSIKLSPGKIQRTGVKSEPVVRRLVKSLIRAPGTVQEDERRVSVVALRFEGFVESVANVTTGDHVHKGQPLMNVYSPALSSAAAEYLSAINAGATGKELKGARRRLENLATPEPAIRELERTREILLSIPWLAPQDGEILERNAVNGMRAGPGDVLFRIADHRLVWVLIDVAERDLAQVAVGTKVTVRPRALASQSFGGTVALIYPHLNAATRTARIRIEVPNPDELLRPEMYVDAEIEVGTPGPVLAVPESAVLDSGSRQAVLVDKGEGRFEPREVKLGRRGGGFVEVAQGVSEGEAVVTSANFLIDAESNLKAALKGFSEANEKPAEPAVGSMEARP
ncbi:MULTISPECIES: efflux RND transporter periplasmic adaptor subunit [unclassified Bradyrhizobium]|uniref:efflux RND transporter periplasmic adaptor subunit n=1 Tax=unclassified Bradyrhizobium TaxID=2631580 RepID=UPI002478A283|nr:MULTISPECIES: efflux RND transporter periplasmic adaptor subunit [unclassified Bradyrhizobium]WGR74779.1 efflux RND transporter periplasmic adaptor subunit [Bradyrhizobium sp. ISRA426]WGR79614.1 efflux RND transporter periplasmic adaptor subunit [Bradyrhizobium sp. ISRA430]WGR89951.1 efflux RND transporter periplasmic adaptor subunit [Bradyrhizobium sp. ISRA432]